MAAAAGGRRGTLITTIVAAAAVLAVVAGALLSTGYDAQKTPVRSTSVWVTRSTGQYGRVDTALGQLDTVQNADTPSGVTQVGSTGVVYTDGYQKMWPIDAADPQSLESTTTKSASDSTSGSSGGGQTSPAGTRKVIGAGRWAVYLTDVGHVFVQDITATGSAATPVQIPAPRGGRAGGAYTATAAAVAPDGTVVLYSSADHAVRRFDAVTDSFVGGATTLSSPPSADAKLAMTVVGGVWALAEPSRDRLWVQGHGGARTVRFGGDPIAENGTTAGDTAYFADDRGLIAVDLRDDTVSRVLTASGTPAAPTVVAGTVYAAWVGQSHGTLWSAAHGRSRPLQVPNGVLAHSSGITPVIASNGDSAVLNETSSGLLWTIPGGTLIPLSQWSAQNTPQTQQRGVQVADVTQEEPPVAQPSSFGVRAGQQTLLPVLLNAYDPNKKDVITIDPGSVSALSTPGFGSLSLTDDDQQLVVDVHAQSGSATFTYAATDGLEKSASVTVTLHVVPSSRNSAPEWCGIQDCQQPWPTASLVPGGTTVVPVLTGWVDPDGDPMVLESAVKDNPKAPITVVPTADGSVAIRHNDPNAPGATYDVTVTVVDSHGAATSKTLAVDVSSAPSLTVQHFVAVASVGQQRTITIGDHVQGGSGAYRLLDAVAASSGQQSHLSVSPNTAAGTFTLSASAVGEYLVDFTMQDTQTHLEQNGEMRFSVVSRPQPLSLPPLTAFVQPDEDTTLNVIEAAQNTSGRVLSLVSATADAPGLSVSVVGNEKLRVSGSTPNGQPGEIGVADIRLTDGAGATVTGQVAVFLAPRSSGVPPIAVPDAVTVRAGDEVDIPVTANDIAPRGEQITLAPTLQTTPAPGQLAFVSGSDIRYLAPTRAGEYTVQYSIYLASDPTKTSTAAVSVTVIGAGQDHAPEPETLVGRVIAGSTVAIAVPSSGMDPDGDTTTLVGVQQPRAGQGAAVISADGSSIDYSAPAGGVPGGQVQFGYTVRDGKGETGSGVVAVSVLGGADANVTPVTYTDTLHAVVGSSEAITAQPLLGDIDPSGGTLRLTSLVPDAPQRSGDGEYARLASLIAPGTDLAHGIVKLRAGDVQGVQSYIYTVESSVTSSTAQGLIVVDVVADAAPELPTVTDTVVTLANRAQLSTGIDVVAGKVVWPSGDVGRLTLAVWGAAADRYTVVDGTRISGPDPQDGALVPFSLTGTDFGGRKTVAYGFLRIPAFDDMPVPMRANLKPFKVGEDSSTTIHVAQAVTVGSSDQLEVKQSSSLPVQRSAAHCSTQGGGDAVTYSAGRNAPWTDTCTVQVRVAGQSTWTSLPLPIVIEPKAPQAVLSPLARTVPPGQTQTIDLYNDMTSWEGGRIGDPSRLDYRVSYSGTDFVVTQNGTTVTIQARADAHPGAVDTAEVSVSSYGGLSATITLTVGIAPPDAPRGATFTRVCEVTSPSCVVSVIGQPGQYDPFQGEPGGGLKLAGIGAVDCSVADVAVSGNDIVATWPAGARPAGGTCVVPYTVTDAQGRIGPGTLTLDVQGYPATPSSITAVGYTGTSVTLMVTLGDAAAAHPALSGVAIYEDGKPSDASCSAGAAGTYTCVVGGLVNGQRHSFTARAVNAVGQSADTTPVVAWAYQTPTISGLTATSVAPVTPSTGTASITLTSGGDVAGFQITSDSGASESVPRQGTTTTVTMQLPVGVRTLTAVPTSQFQPPVGGGGDTGAAATTTVQVAGTPYFDSQGSLDAVSNTELRFDGVQPDANYSAKGTTALYAVWPSGSAAPSCTDDGNGDPVMAGGQSSPDFPGLTDYTYYSGLICLGNGYGVVQSQQFSAYTWTSTQGVPSGNYSYTIGTTPRYTTSGSYTTGASFLSITDPTVPAPGNSRLETYYSDATTGSTNFDDLISSGSLPGTISVAYCTRVLHHCGASATVTAATAPTTVTVAVDSSAVTTPTVGDLTFSGAIDQPEPTGSSTTGSSDDVSVSIAIDLTHDVVTYTIQFSGAFAALGHIALTRPYQPPTAASTSTAAPSGP